MLLEITILFGLHGKTINVEFSLRNYHEFFFRYSSSPGPMPAGWGFETFWQYTDNAAPNPGDGDIFNGDYDHLKQFALH